MEQEKYQSKYNMHFETGSNPTILNDVRIDKIEVSARGNFGAALRGRIDEAKDEMPTQSDTAPTQHTKDEKLSHAIKVLEASKEFKNKSDYAWVFRALAKGGIIPVETSSPEFIKIMKGNGAKKLPVSTTSINRFLSAIDKDDKVGEFTFTDTVNPQETLRRNNVAKIFIAAYNKF